MSPQLLNIVGFMSASANTEQCAPTLRVVCCGRYVYVGMCGLFMVVWKVSVNSPYVAVSAAWRRIGSLSSAPL